jgi:hypothetical protein
MYDVAEKCVDSDSKIYNFGSPWPTPVAVNLTAYLFRFRSCCSSKSFFRQVLRHSQASILSIDSAFLSGVRSLLALLKALSHSVGYHFCLVQKQDRC